MSLLTTLEKTIQDLIFSFDDIPHERKKLLQQLTQFIREKKEARQNIDLIFICTHNSRRSHMAQLWAQAAATYYGISRVTCYSGGTEATAFYPAAVRAMQTLGFDIEKETTGDNSKYSVKYASDASSVKVWSKRFDDSANPTSGFCAIMTCSDADNNCPIVAGAEKRIALPYEDPKKSDGTALQDEVYEKRARQIGQEILYAFSKVEQY